MTDEYMKRMALVEKAFADCGDKIELETWEKAMVMSRNLRYEDQKRILTDHFEKLIWRRMKNDD